MAVRDILLHMGDDELANARCAAAMALAQSHEAHLTALYVAKTPYIPGYIRAYIGEEVLAEQRRQVLKLAEAAEKRFNDSAERNGVSHEWRIAFGDDRVLMEFHARYANLAVVSQGKVATEHTEGVYDLAEELVLSAGRPVLVIPYAGKWPIIGDQVMVAWNGGREAARAVSEAMPFLERAEKVTVFSVGPDAENHIPGTDLCTHLARHGVKAVASHTMAKDVDVGNLVLSAAFDMSADLLVMGAYGHSRLRELALGGATREILGHMTLPVLMAH